MQEKRDFLEMEKPSRIVIHAGDKKFPRLRRYYLYSNLLIPGFYMGSGAQDQIGGVSILDVQCIL